MRSQLDALRHGMKYSKEADNNQ
ncbi:hypothetical protein, partial [Salmonella enterica]